jgi:hypothetical protein
MLSTLNCSVCIVHFPWLFLPSIISRTISQIWLKTPLKIGFLACPTSFEDRYSSYITRNCNRYDLSLLFSWPFTSRHYRSWTEVCLQCMGRMAFYLWLHFSSDVPGFIEHVTTVCSIAPLNYVNTNTYYMNLIVFKYSFPSRFPVTHEHY